jgi:hypothetical protein
MRMLLVLFFVVACGHVRTDGGQGQFDPTLYSSLGPSEHPLYAQTIVRREERDPEGITLEELRQSPAGRIDRIGLVLFETQFQPSRTGLAVGQNVYLSPRGKQALAEEAWVFWNQTLRARSLGLGVEWWKRDDMDASAAYRGYGTEQTDFLLSRKHQLNSDDAFWKSGGQEIPMESLVLPSRQQNVSILFIPATEMMLGPKMVEHQKHWVNDICKAHNLDAVLIVSSIASWTQGSKDKRSGEVIPEEMKVEIHSSLLYPFSKYHQAAALAKGLDHLPKKSVPLASYSVKTAVPITLTVPEEQKNFATIERNVLLPLRSTYHALSTLMIERLIQDIHSTRSSTPAGVP